jgi:hypothetical protein
MPCAWARRNSLQVGPVRRGAGPSRAVRSRERIVVAPTRIPSLRSSPSIRTRPQRGLSRASLRMSARTSGSIGGRPRPTGPAVPPLPAYELAVPAQERRRGDEEDDPAPTWDDPACGSEQDPVEGRSLGGPAVRRSTRSWWRRTRTSRSLDPSARSACPALTRRRARARRRGRGEATSADRTGTS